MTKHTCQSTALTLRGQHYVPRTVVNTEARHRSRHLLHDHGSATEVESTTNPRAPTMATGHSKASKQELCSRGTLGATQKTDGGCRTICTRAVRTPTATFSHAHEKQKRDKPPTGTLFNQQPRHGRARSTHAESLDGAETRRRRDGDARNDGSRVALRGAPGDELLRVPDQAVRERPSGLQPRELGVSVLLPWWFLWSLWLLQL